MFRLLAAVPFLLLSYLHSAPLTIQDCFQLSLEENPKTVSSCMKVKQAREESLIEKAAYYPELKASAHGFKWQTHNFLELSTIPPGIPPNILPSIIGPTEDYGYLVSARYTLYDFGEAKERYLAARSKKGAAEFDRIRLQEEILLNVAIAFYQVASNDALFGVAKNNLERTEHHLKLVQEKRDVGTAPLSDLLRAQVDVAEAKLNLVRIESQVEIARARLREAIGLDSDLILTIQADRSNRTKPEEDDLLWARKTACASRPEIRSLWFQITGRTHQLKAVQSTNWPKVTALGAYGKRDSDFLPEDDEWLFGVRMEMPLFTGFRITHEEGKAKANVREAQANLASAKLKIEEEVHTAYSRLKEAFEVIETTSIQVKDAKEGMRLTEERYEAGASTLTDLLDAQTQLLRAEANHVSAEWNFEAAIFYFQWTQGILSDNLCRNNS